MRFTDSRPRRSRCLSLARFALVGLLAAPALAASFGASALGSFLYCHQEPKRLGSEVFAGKPTPAGSLEFGLSLWQGTRHIGVFGTAVRTEQGWEYQDNMDAENAAERCRLEITRATDGTLRVVADPQATCTARGGQGTWIGVVTFPPATFEGPVTHELDADRNFDAAGKCWRAKTS